MQSIHRLTLLVSLAFIAGCATTMEQAPSACPPPREGGPTLVYTVELVITDGETRKPAGRITSIVDRGWSSASGALTDRGPFAVRFKVVEAEKDFGLLLRAGYGTDLPLPEDAPDPIAVKEGETVRVELRDGVVVEANLTFVGTKEELEQREAAAIDPPA